MTTSFIRSLPGRLLVAALLLGSANAQAWWNPDWSYRKAITLDATPAGAVLTGDVKDAVVLVRLHEGVFNFAEGGADGADLRFIAEDDKTELAHHVEKYDPVFNLAFVWVRVPLLPNGKPAPIWLYYGNAKATVPVESKNSYPAEQLLVYHFGEKGSPVQDATAFAHHATTAVSALDESGLIGNAARFDGATSVQLPASPSLNLTAGTSFTWSAWVRSAAGVTGVLYSQRDAGGAALLIGLNGGVPYVSASDAGGALTSAQATAALAADGWNLLTITGGTELRLHVDGVLVATLPRPTPAITGAAVLGGDLAAPGQPLRSGFVGEIDELQIAKTQQDANALRLAAVNQGSADRLVSFGADEAQAGSGGSHFAVIMDSLTVDAWVCMIVLALMMLASFYIMARKGRQIGAASKGNRQFMALYQQHDGDFTTLQQALEPAGESPLSRMFRVGRDEVGKRVARQPGAALSSQSIDAIRASLHGTLIRENQELNRLMVLLTIAISGGPFIGLLGTVLGVMITFASVAAAGEVNVNAIAPGISAALAATVTGLFVAIPSLFGYNYLLTRAKECSADMQVFVDEFVTRVAEQYRGADVSSRSH